MSVIYWIILAALLVLAILLDKQAESSLLKTGAFWCMCFVLAAVAGCSYGLGGDKFLYMDVFLQYPRHDICIPELIYNRFCIRSEMPLWTLMAYYVGLTTESFYVLQWIVALLINGSIVYVVMHNSDRWFTFLLLYTLSFTCFMFSTELLREACAMSMCLPAIHSWTRGRKGLFFLFTFLGLMFHISAGITLLFPMVSMIRIRQWDWKILLIAIVSAFVIWGIYDPIRHYILGIELTSETPSIIHKLVVFARTGTYIGGILYDMVLYIILPFVAFSLSLLWEKDRLRYEAKKQMYLFALLLGVIVVPISGFVRFYNYAQVFYLMALADMVVGTILHRRYIVLGVSTIGLMLGHVYRFYSSRHWPGSDVAYYQLWYPYTPIGTDYQTVEYRKIAHDKAVENL